MPSRRFKILNSAATSGRRCFANSTSSPSLSPLFPGSIGRSPRSPPPLFSFFPGSCRHCSITRNEGGFMDQHKYLRAYMAGIVVPTIVLVIGVTAFCIARYVYDLPVPIERLMIFPMAAVPNLWGLWNVLYVALRPRWQHPIGLHGALLPFLLA